MPSIREANAKPVLDAAAAVGFGPCVKACVKENCVPVSGNCQKFGRSSRISPPNFSVCRLSVLVSEPPHDAVLSPNWIRSLPPNKFVVPELGMLKLPPIPATMIEGNDSGISCDFNAAGKPSVVMSKPLLNGRRLFSSRVKLKRKLPTSVGLNVAV